MASGVLCLLWFYPVALERLNELSSFLKTAARFGQDNYTAPTSLMLGFTSCEMFGAYASAFRGQDMLHRPSDDAQRKRLVVLPRSLQALPGNHSDIDSNGSVKQFVPMRS